MKNTRLKEIEERLKEFCLANKVEKKGDFDPVEKLVRVIEEIDSNYLSTEVFDSIPDGIVGINEENEIIIFNAQAEVIFGYSEAEISGRLLETLIPLPYVKTHQQHTASYMNDPLVKPMGGRKKDMFGLRKNGDEFPVDINLSFLESSNGRIALAVVRDITEQTKTKKMLQESKEQFESLFEYSPDAIFIHNFDTLTHANQACLRLLGYENLDEFVGKPALETTVAPQDYHIVKAARSELQKQGIVFLPQVRFLKKDGTIVITECHVSTVSFQETPHLQIISRDITDRKKMARQLQESQEHLAAVNENSPDIICSVDEESKITYINRVGSDHGQFGASGSNILDFIPDSFKKQFEKYIKSTFEGESQEFVMKVKDENSRRSWFSVRMSRIENRSSFREVLIITTDISERKKAEIRNNIVNAISNKLNSYIRVDDFCKFVFAELQNLKPFPNLYISEYNKEENMVSIFFSVENYEVKSEFPEPRVAGNGLSEHVLKTTEGLLLNGMEIRSFHQKNKLKVYGNEAKSWVGVPLVSENQATGVLAVQSFTDENAYDRDDLNLLSFIGTQIGSLIEKDRAEKEISQFEKYFSVSMDLLCIAGTDGYFKKINPKFSEALGYSEEELLSKSFIEFIHPEDIDATNLEVEKLSQGTSTIDFMNRYRCKNGAYKWFLWACATDTKTGLLYAAAKDITERMKSQEMLAALSKVQDTFIAEATTSDSFEKMLSVLLDVTDSEYGFIGEVLYDDDQPYLKTHAITNISWNKETSRFYEENAPKGMEFKNMKTLFGRVITSGKPVIANDPYNDPRRGGLPSGHPHMGSFMGLPFYSGDELVGMVGVANKPDGYSDKDVEMLAPFLSTCSTLIKAYQGALKKVDAEKEVKKLADIVSYSSDAIISTDKNGKVISWNSGAEKLLGYTRAEIIGASVARLGPKELRDAHAKIIQEVRNGKSIESYETLQLKKGNVSTHVNMSIFPLIDENGEVYGISSILRDISEQKEALRIKEEFTKNLETKVRERTRDLEKTQIELALSLEKEKRLSQLKSRFVSTASHQFRTPLSIIQASIAILDMQKDEMGEQLKPRFDKVYSRIKGQISRMTNLMDDVLILGKINSGSIKLSMEPTDLVLLCNEISATYNEIQEDARKVEVSVNGKPKVIAMDVKLVEHAISNIVSNAFKYSIGKPAPSIDIDFQESEVKICVKDHGIGIPEQDLENLFEPFYRASNVNEFSGTGLGFAIAKEYVELNGGTIEVISEQNRGSEVIITFKK